MNLKQLLESTDPLMQSGCNQVEISSITCDSRKVTKGSLFFAIKGEKSDGHDFINAAVQQGASAIMLENTDKAPDDGTAWVQVKDSRRGMALVSDLFFGEPGKGIPLIGITGTNGKTTTSFLVEAVMEAAGLPAAVLGTISYRFGDVTFEANHTTPESTELQGIMRQLVDAGAKSCVMEVSSHSLEQHRVDGCHFDVAIFTNLTRDHLDYHGSMESYRDAKLRLFSELLLPDQDRPHCCAVINNDDPAADSFVAAARCRVIRYGLKLGADVTAKDLTSSVHGINGTVVTPLGEATFSSDLVGAYNLSNILAAIAAGVALQIPLETIIKGIEQHKTVPGRLEKVPNQRGVTCLVDYAHTGDALENVLATLKKLATARIITIFGCGGDRDNGKRPIMGRIAAEYSDLAIVTSDNPRTEEPYRILQQIKSGIPPLGIREYQPKELEQQPAEKGFVMIENRREAIRLGTRLAQPGDILLLAGKGHEDYQIIGTVKHHFDDREEVAACMAELA